MSNLTRTNRAVNQVIIGWCSYQKGGRITNVQPDGYESGGDGDEWNEELWCHWRIEESLAKYNEAYEKLNRGYGLRASKQMRTWLYEIFWDSVEPSVYKDSEPMVVREVSNFRRLVEEQIKLNPKSKQVKEAMRIDPYARAVLNPEYKGA